MRILISLIIMLGVTLSTGCQPNPMDAGTSLEVIASPTALPLSTPLPDPPTPEIATPDRMNATMTKNPERIPPTEIITPVVGEVPADLLDSILKDLAGRIGAAVEKITIIQAQAIVWNDGSLGCAQPGEFYTQAFVNGYWVILEVDGKQYDYRATDRGYFSLCEGKFHPNPPSGTPGS
jgi:hypothetical protein